MKKLLILVLLIINPLITEAETCKDIEISYAEALPSSVNTNHPIINNNQINIDIDMIKIDDTSTYKIVLTNKSNDTYSLDKKIPNNNYILYSLDFENNSMYIEPHSTKELILKIIYKNKYSFNNNEELLSINDDIIINLRKVNNPETHTNYNTIISIIILLAIITFLPKKRKKLSVFLIPLLPIIIQASECDSIVIKINTNITKTYSVDYLVDLSSYYLYYYTNEELNDPNIDFSNANCNHIPTYIGEINEDNKYTPCIGEVLYKSKNTYIKNQNVILNSISLRNISSFDNNYNIVCQNQGNYRFCQNETRIDYDTINIWQYSKSVIDTNSNYSYEEDDLAKMNFTMGTYSNFWNNFGRFTVKTPNSFTMPNHNVIFKSL